MTDSLFIYNIKYGKVKQKEKFKLLLNPLFYPYFYSILKKNKIDMVMCNYCRKFFMDFLRFNGIEIISGLNGDPDSIIEMFIKGDLQYLHDPKLKNKNPNNKKKDARKFPGN